jgi:superoxide dismutase, Fe-Mn family
MKNLNSPSIVALLAAALILPVFVSAQSPASAPKTSTQQAPTQKAPTTKAPAPKAPAAKEPTAKAQTPPAPQTKSGSAATAAQATNNTFTLPALPYAYDALSTVIDAQTMELHHQRHHGAQVTALNAAISATPSLAGQSLGQLLANASTVPAAVRNNAGGHWNHSFFWTIMAPAGQGGSASPALTEAITRDFGSMDNMKAQFRAASLARFGSGWAWVVKKPDGKLAITSTPNQDNPLMDVADVRGMPILGNDVWEHAYYLKYQNKRADYVDAWWSLINWTEVSKRFEAKE